MSLWRWVVTVVVGGGLLLATVQEGWAQQRRPLDLVLVLDVSGSMKKHDPEALMGKIVKHFVGQLGAEDAAGLVLFGTRATAAQPLGPLAEAGHREALLDKIGQIRYADANTNIAAAFERGLYELKSKGRPGSNQVLLFATDGIMDTGSPSRDEEMKRWLREQLLPDARQRGLRIFSIAFTEDADFTLMQEMARTSGGEYFRAMSAKDFGLIFDQITVALQRTLETTREKSEGVAPAPETELPLWLVGGIILLMALFVALFWRSMRTRFSRAVAVEESKTVVAGPAPAKTVPIPPAELMDLDTRDVIALDKAVVRIGRDLDNDVLISAPTVSGHHAQIEFQNGQFYLQDLRSSNGTFVNKQKVEGNVLLKSGDIIRFDQFRYTFLGPEPMSGGTMIRGTALGEGVDTGRRKKTLFLEADSVKAAAEDQEAAAPKCPTHGGLDATVRCSHCQKLWCAACVQTVGENSLCSVCRKTAGADLGSRNG